MSVYYKTLFSGWTLALRSIQMQMREHLLGYAWVLIIPALYAICYVYIKRELTGADVDSVHFGVDALRAFTGITLFQFWLQLVRDMSGLIRKQKGMLRGLDISATPFVMAIIFESAVSLAIRTLLIIIAVPILGLSLPIDVIPWLVFLSCLVVLILSASAVGLLLLPWSALYADVSKALSSIMLPMLLISPVFYPAVKDTDSWLFWINSVNPVASPLAIINDLFQSNEYALYLLPMTLWAGAALVLVVWSLSQLKKQVPILLERVGN